MAMNRGNWSDEVTALQHDIAAFRGRRGETIHGAFETLVAAEPQRLAVVASGQAISYGALNARANRLAWRLLQVLDSETRMNPLVALHVEQGVETLVALLAILKTGSAYLPIDPELPLQRVRGMLTTAKPRLMLVRTRQFGDEVADLVQVATRAELEEQSLACSPRDLDADVSPTDLAYVIYTSGSTGEPKGVMVEHAGVVNLARAQRDAFGVDATWRVLQFYSFAFDASVFEAYMAILNGGTLIIEPREVLLDSELLRQTIQR